MQQVKWAEFELQDLFDKLDLRFKKTKFDKEKDISRERTEEFDLPLVNAKNGDNGIMYYGRGCDFDSAEMTIDIVGDGAVSTGNVYPQPQRTGVLYNAYLIKPRFNANKQLLYFFASAIQKSIKLKYGYENKAGWEKVKKEKISLPIKPNANLDKLAQIDFDFMENFISQLEAFRLSQLEAYLLVTGLKNYTLTTAEKQALADFENGKVVWGKYRFADIFNKIQQGRRLKKDDQVAGNIPFVMAGITNTGVVNYISNPVASFPKNSITIDIFGNAFYRSYAFGAGDDTGVYWNDKKELSKEMMLFLTKSAEKALAGKFSYGKKLRSSQSLNFKMQLPTANQQPDYSFMETLISAVQKLVIKDVVLYADRKIAATRQVIKK